MIEPKGATIRISPEAYDILDEEQRKERKRTGKKPSHAELIGRALECYKREQSGAPLVKGDITADFIPLDPEHRRLARIKTFGTEGQRRGIAENLIAFDRCLDTGGSPLSLAQPAEQELEISLPEPTGLGKSPDEPTIDPLRELLSRVNTELQHRDADIPEKIERISQGRSNEARRWLENCRLVVRQLVNTGYAVLIDEEEEFIDVQAGMRGNLAEPDEQDQAHVGAKNPRGIQSGRAAATRSKRSGRSSPKGRKAS